MLNYSAKKIQFDDFILDSVHQSRPIQIIQFNKSDFDISSFIEFADSITIDYICYYKAVRKNSFIMYASYVDLHQDFHPCIIVKIKFEDSKYKVYVQDEIRRIKQSKIDDENCLTFKAFSTENNQVFNFENRKWDSQFPYKDSVLYNFGNYAAKKNTCAPIFLKYTFDGFLNQKTHNRNKKFITVYDDFIKILEHLPGFIYMEYSAIKEEPQLKHKPLIMNIDNKKSILASLTWIMPWAEKVSNDCHYIEINGSYKACEPYHYCIFHGIIYNNSLPFDVTLFPSESSELFDMLFVGLQKHQISMQNFENKPTLSDLGSAIKKFCADHGMSQNLCHRHLIENIGPKF
ncbi:hypothetical protein M9Y10_040182 [Tritrichomonas musculus]|uniref:Uncharacterized protein n=1 Tax=Tritrichomonas musculus TaxID=1915356 RepID=A0ABR2GRX4_9EUKA